MLIGVPKEVFPGEKRVLRVAHGDKANAAALKVEVSAWNAPGGAK